MPRTGGVFWWRVLVPIDPLTGWRRVMFAGASPLATRPHPSSGGDPGGCNAESSCRVEGRPFHAERSMALGTRTPRGERPPRRTDWAAYSTP